MSATYAAPALRDRFLCALGSPIDRGTTIRLAQDLVDSCNPLPGTTCEELGLPSNSTYGQAARWILARHAAALAWEGI
jgi:hypothetical protein